MCGGGVETVEGGGRARRGVEAAAGNVCGPLNSERREGDESSVPNLEEGRSVQSSRFFFSFLELDASLTFFSHAFFYVAGEGFFSCLVFASCRDGGKHVDG